MDSPASCQPSRLERSIRSSMGRKSDLNSSSKIPAQKFTRPPCTAFEPMRASTNAALFISPLSASFLKIEPLVPQVRALVPQHRVPRLTPTCGISLPFSALRPHIWGIKYSFLARFSGTSGSCRGTACRARFILFFLRVLCCFAVQVFSPLPASQKTTSILTGLLIGCTSGSTGSTTAKYGQDARFPAIHSHIWRYFGVIIFLYNLRSARMAFLTAFPPSHSLPLDLAAQSSPSRGHKI
jgi:hypothetical protein